MNIRTFVAILSRNPQYDFPKMRGGQRPFGTFPKIHPFWWHHLSLRDSLWSQRTSKLRPVDLPIRTLTCPEFCTVWSLHEQLYVQANRGRAVGQLKESCFWGEWGTVEKSRRCCWWPIHVVACLSRLPCYVFCICLLTTTNKYQKYKSVEIN